MIRHFEIGHFRFAEALQFHVLRIVLPKRNVVCDNVRNAHHRLFKFCFRFRAFRFNGKLAFRVCFYLCFYLLRFLSLALFHKHTHLFGKGISCGAERIAFRDQCAAFRIERKRFVYEGQLMLLEFSADIRFYQLRVGTDKIDIDHLDTSVFLLILFDFYLLYNFFPVKANKT
jgi:hypothetical protein